MAEVYVAAGSNVEPEKNLARALAELEQAFGPLAISPAYRNPAVGFAGADFINLAKQLVEEKNCRSCHQINGRGGVIGPDLTNVGDKSPEQYDYGRVTGKRSAFAWHVAHFQSPKSVSPGTVMPDFNFSTKEAQALTLLALSWRI